HLRTAQLPSLFRMSEQESIVFDPEDLPADFAYVALGHIHQPQAVRGAAHVRYSGSIKRLDLGEQRDSKSVVLVELEGGGLAGDPGVLPMEAPKVYPVEVRDPRVDLAALRERYADARRDLVRVDIKYTAGVDDLEKVLRELDDIFPRWYERDWKEASSLGPAVTPADQGPGRGYEETVRDYLHQELMNHPDAVRDAVLGRAETLLAEATA